MKLFFVVGLLASLLPACASSSSEDGEADSAAGALAGDDEANVEATFRASDTFKQFAATHSTCPPEVTTLQIDDTHGNRGGRKIWVVDATPSCGIDDFVSAVVRLDWQDGTDDDLRVLATPLDGALHAAVDDESPDSAATSIAPGTDDSDAAHVEAKFRASDAFKDFAQRNSTCAADVRALQIDDTHGNQGGRRVWLVAATPTCGMVDFVSGVVRVDWQFDSTDVLMLRGPTVDATIRQAITSSD